MSKLYFCSDEEGGSKLSVFIQELVLGGFDAPDKGRRRKLKKKNSFLFLRKLFFCRLFVRKIIV